MREEIRPDIIRYQRKVVDVLYAWAQTQHTLPKPTGLVPVTPITHPTRPTQDAPLAEWREYYLRMATITEWQMDVDQWRGSVESRLEGVEAMTGLIPEILERLGPQTLTSAQQRQVQALAHQLSHRGSHLRMSSTPDAILEHAPQVCSTCQQELVSGASSLRERRQVVELPVLRVQVMEHLCMSKTCPCCQIQTQGVFPDDVAASVQYGHSSQSGSGVSAAKPPAALCTHHSNPE